MKRLSWIDNLKGFLLMLVVVSHTSPTEGGWGVEYYGVFYMPAFFLISGVLYNHDKWGGGIGSYVKSKVRTLLWPYFSLSFLLLLLDPTIYFTDCQFEPAGSLQVLLASLDLSPKAAGIMTKLFTFTNDIVQGHSFAHVGALWFVYSLFFTSVLFHAFSCAFKHLLGQRLWLGAVVYSAVTLLASWCLYESHIQLPFSMDVICCSSVFYAAGVALRHVVLDKITSCTVKTGCVLLLSSFVCYAFGYFTNGMVGLNGNMLGAGHFLPGFVLGTFGGSLLVITLFALVSRSEAVCRWMYPLRIMARNAIMLLPMHMFVISQLRCWCPGCPAVLILVIECVVVALLIPVFNKYLYFLIGKKKSEFGF